MTDLYCEELFVTPVQEETTARSSRIRKLVEVLIQKRASAADREAVILAGRAISPLLDYSSLVKLGRFLKLADAFESKTAPLRLAILGGPTTIQFRQLVEIFLASEGIVAQVYEGGFDLFRQEILDPNSSRCQHSYQRRGHVLIRNAPLPANRLDRVQRLMHPLASPIFHLFPRI